MWVDGLLALRSSWSACSCGMSLMRCEVSAMEGGRIAVANSGMCRHALDADGNWCTGFVEMRMVWARG